MLQRVRTDDLRLALTTEQRQLEVLGEDLCWQLEQLHVGARDRADRERLQPRDGRVRQQLTWPDERRLHGLLARRPQLREQRRVASEHEQRLAQRVHAGEDELAGGHPPRAQVEAEAKVNGRPRGGAAPS